MALELSDGWKLGEFLGACYKKGTAVSGLLMVILMRTQKEKMRAVKKISTFLENT